MKIAISHTGKELGRNAAAFVAERLRALLAEKETVRIVVSTGASQLDTIEALRGEALDWSRIEMFHLDEYVGLPDTHKASFRKYLRERLADHVPLKAAHWVEDTTDCIPALTREIRRAPIDLGLIGIGENGHIAFNDPPADFATGEAFHVVKLDDACKRQQMGEGWFAAVEDVPHEAISMTVRQIMACGAIVSCVPNAVKAAAIAKTLAAPEPDPMVPASILKTHPQFSLFVDDNSWNGFDERDIVVPAGAELSVERF